MSDEPTDTPIEEPAIEVFESEGGALEAEASPEETAPDYLDDLRRVQAEFENFRKRTVRDQAAVIQRANAFLMSELLPVLDDFDLALLSAGQTQDFDKMVKGVELVYAKMRETLTRVGLEKMESRGKPFNPAEHEAVMRAEDDGDASIVVEEFRPGYRLGGIVIRPAMVKVGPASSGS